MTATGTLTTTRSAAAEWRAIGVTVRVVVGSPEALPAATALLREELDRLDRTCSRFRADSELRALDAASGREQPVSPLLAEAVAVALAAAAGTGGAVDPTLGAALTDLGYDRDQGALPADGPAVRVRVVDPQAWRRIVLDRDAGTLRLPVGVRLDLGATAKALGADRAAARIHRELGTGVLVSLGGDLAVAGPGPDGDPDGGWPVRVQEAPGPLSEVPAGCTQTVTLHAGGIATSGITARRWVRGGRALHHLLDPATGLPARTPWRTVTVVAPSCVAANTTSTATIVRGDAGLDRLARTGLPARLVALDGTVTRTGGWPAP